MLPFQQDSSGRGVTLWRQHDNVARVSKTTERTVPVVFKAARGSSHQFAVPLATHRSCMFTKRDVHGAPCSNVKDASHLHPLVVSSPSSCKSHGSAVRCVYSVTHACSRRRLRGLDLPGPAEFKFIIQTDLPLKGRFFIEKRKIDFSADPGRLNPKNANSIVNEF